MKVRRCCICDSPIVNGRCKVCGMPYRNDEEMYHLNENRRDHYKHSSPQVRERLLSLERPKPAKRTKTTASSGKKSVGAYTSSGRASGVGTSAKGGKTVSWAEKKPKKKTWLLILIGVLCLLEILPLLTRAAEDFFYELPGIFDEFGGHEEVSEEEVVWEFDGDYTTGNFAQVFTSGEYVVGQQLPSGIYSVTLTEGDGEMNLQLEDFENGLFEFKVFTHEKGEKDDYLVEKMDRLVLKDGGVLRLSGQGSLEFVCEEAYFTERYQEEENPLTEEVAVRETMEAGKDFQPGVYDVQLKSGRGNLEITISEDEKFSLYLREDSEYAVTSFLNVNLPEGATLFLEDYGVGYGEKCQVFLKPSKAIYREKTE